MASRGLFAAALLAVFVAFAAAEFATLGPFSFSDEQLPWAQAVASCKANNQSLVSVDSREKDEALLNLLLNNGNNGNGSISNSTVIKGQSWSSGHEVSEGVWQWESTGRPFFYTRWFVGQPDDTANLNCVYLATSGRSNLLWRDANCSAAMYYICE